MLLRRHREKIAEEIKPKIEPIVVDNIVEPMVENPTKQIDVVEVPQEVSEVEHATPKAKKTTRKPKQ